jgi:N-acetylmuramoyl-L-alanine amidase
MIRILRTFSHLLPLLPALLLAACGTQVYYVRPPDWKTIMQRDSATKAYEGALKGVTIFLDPGHGGSELSAIGPSGGLREADVNLRVALKLREHLKRAGANVIMSRETDQSVPLEARAQQANVNRADIFLSIHHAFAEDDFTDQTATIYRSRPGAPGYQPSSHDLARYIHRDLAYVLGNPGPLTTFDGTLSDQAPTVDKDAAVLRDARMTAVMVECATITSAYEERRLKIDEFNEIEAWGIFRGIAKYLQAGIPVLKYASPRVFAESRPRLDILVTDHAAILDESVRVFVDGREEGFSYDRKEGRISVTVSSDLGRGYHQITAQVRNENENASAPFAEYFAIGAPPALLRQTTDPQVIPQDERAYALVSVKAVDTAGNAMPDGLPIHITTNEGLDTLLLTRNGEALLTIVPGKSSNINFEASNGPVKTEGAIAVVPGAPYTRGIVMGSDGKAVPQATIKLAGLNNVVGTRQGEYILGGSKVAGLEALVEAPGYFARREAITESIVQDPVVLTPVAKGVLQGKRVLIDARVPDASTGKTGGMELLVVDHLRHLLSASGVIIEMLPQGADAKKQRAQMLSGAPDALVLRIGTIKKTQKISLSYGTTAGSRPIAELMSKALPARCGLGVMPPAARFGVKDEFEKSRWVGMLLPPSDRKTYDESSLPRTAWGVAWGMYEALLSHEGYKTKGTKSVEVRVVDKQSRAPAPNAEVELNHTLRAACDAKGVCVFRAVNILEDDVRVLDPDHYEISGVKTEAVN